MKILKEFLVCVILVCPCLMANEFEPKLNLTSLYDYDYSQEYYEDLDKKSQTELPEMSTTKFVELEKNDLTTQNVSLSSSSTASYTISEEQTPSPINLTSSLTDNLQKNVEENEELVSSSATTEIGYLLNLTQDTTLPYDELNLHKANQTEMTSIVFPEVQSNLSTTTAGQDLKSLFTKMPTTLYEATSSKPVSSNVSSRTTVSVPPQSVVGQKTETRKFNLKKTELELSRTTTARNQSMDVSENHGPEFDLDILVTIIGVSILTLGNVMLYIFFFTYNGCNLCYRKLKSCLFNTSSSTDEDIEMQNRER